MDAKVRDVIGLYLNPPENAVVVCIDEKAQTQALDRTAPTLPMPRLPFATETHVDAAPSTWPNSSRHELQTPPDM